MAASRRELLRLLGKLEGPISSAFLADAFGIKSKARIAQLEVAISANDIDAAMRAAGYRPGSWAKLSESIRSAYIEAGTFVASADVPSKLGMSFNWTNPRAEEWLRKQSSEMVTRITKDQRESIQDALTAGMRAGRNPRSTALDIVGRISKATGRRQGGIIGLSRPQTKYVNDMREALTGKVGGFERNGKTVKKFWIDKKGNLKSTYSKRDKRFDSIIRKSIESGKTLSEADINRLVGRYEDRLLKLRGDTIARTEAMSALNEASDESLRQVVEDGLAPADAVKRIWRHSYSKNERPGHLEMDGDERAVDDPFTNPVTGAVLMRPGDGPDSEIVNCFMPESQIQVDGLKGAIRSQYIGDVAKISVGSGANLTVTPNHPILTERGWVAANNIVKGDQLVKCGVANSMFRTKPDIADGVTTAEQLYRSAQSLGSAKRVSSASVNFHGQIPTEDVDVIAFNVGLGRAFNSSVAKFCRNFHFTDTDISKGLAIISRLKPTSAFSPASDPKSSMSSSSPLSAFIRACKRSASYIAFGNAWGGYTKIRQATINNAATNANFAGNAVYGVAFIEQIRDFWQELLPTVFMALVDSSAFFRHQFDFVEITGIDFIHYDGPVYNFETESGLIVADTYITHNCRCILQHDIDFFAVENAS